MILLLDRYCHHGTPTCGQHPAFPTTSFLLMGGEHLSTGRRPVAPKVEGCGTDMLIYSFRHDRVG